MPKALRAARAGRIARRGTARETHCAAYPFPYPAAVISRAHLSLRCRLLLVLCAGTGLPALAAEAPEPTLVIPLRIHLLQASNLPAVHTTLTTADVQRVLGKVNGIWAPAGIRFEVESLLSTRALAVASTNTRPDSRWLLTVLPPESRASNAFNVYYVKQMQPNGYWAGGVAFVKDTASLRAVEGGIDEPLPRVTAHELGHALGLNHRQDVTNLMASGTTGTALNAEEIHAARARAATRDWVREEKSAPGKPDAPSGKERD
jgi:hypothetical protein